MIIIMMTTVGVVISYPRDINSIATMVILIARFELVTGIVIATKEIIIRTAGETLPSIAVANPYHMNVIRLTNGVLEITMAASACHGRNIQHATAPTNLAIVSHGSSRMNSIITILTLQSLAFSSQLSDNILFLMTMRPHGPNPSIFSNFISFTKLL